jgi:asparagine synthetase B (glutamine-hydrolysing)
MTPTMSHRGPDDEGYLNSGPLSLGMRRLSIIDLEGGHQPIFNEDGSVGVVLNGEIYNFQELRKQFVTDLPEKLKRPNGTPKSLLVGALEDLLPPEVVHQPKRGFTFPWAKWLQGPLKQVVEKGLAELSPDLLRVLNREKTDGVWKSYLGGHTSWSRPWSLYVLNEWTKKHLG